MSNCALLFWTSRYFRVLFVSAEGENALDKEKDPSLANISAITKGWTNTDFLKGLIYVEHGCILFQIFLRQIVSEITPKIIKGERDRATLLNNQLKMAECGLKQPELREKSPTLKYDESDSILRDGEKAPNTDYRKNLALDYKKKIKIIDEVAFKMRASIAKGMAQLAASIMEEHGDDSD